MYPDICKSSDTLGRCRHMLKELGTSFIKAGQVLASQPDVVVIIITMLFLSLSLFLNYNFIIISTIINVVIIIIIILIIMVIVVVIIIIIIIYVLDICNIITALTPWDGAGIC
jgi:hypothetical protein